jgi:sterile alpha motif and leucine zipper-containing kinase AZK
VDKGQTESGFNREVAALIRLCHPCIVPFVGFRRPTDTEGAVIATVYMPGGSLKTILESKPDWWNNTAKCRSVMELVSAMKLTHGSNFVHRDLKPANLVFDENHNLYICDFGASTRLFPDCLYHERIGTPMYMAPEVFDGESSNKSDVYSFALILYEIMTGTPGFSPDWRDWRIAHMVLLQGYRPEIPPCVLPWVRELIQECWDFDPDKRPAFSTIEKRMLFHRFQLFPDVDSDFLIRHFEDLRCRIKDQL